MANLPKIALKNILDCILILFTNLLLCLPLMFLIGCYATEVVQIKVKVESNVDMSKYKTLAVMDFIDKKTKPNEMNGKIISRMIRKQLKANKNFNIIEERNMELDNAISEDDIKDPKNLVSISNQLGVDALIVGEFDFYEKYQSVPYIVERYSSKTGRYSPEGRSYMQKIFGLSLKAKVIDGVTGETVFNFAPRAEERPEYRNSFALPFSDGTRDPANLRAMATRPVNNFVLSLMPHYENERRTLVK